MASKKAVFGIVASQGAAELIINDLHKAGFQPGDISVLFPSKGATRDFAHVQGTKAPEGAIAGGGAGGVLGGTLGVLAGLGLLAIPGLGMLVAAGPLMAALGGAAVGAAVGSLTGALVGMGIPEIQAKLYEGKVKGGNILVSVHVADGKEADRAKSIFTAAGAEDVSTTTEASVPRTQDDPKNAEARRASPRT
jgi:hypothetical protein